MELLTIQAIRPIFPELFLCAAAIFLLMAGTFRGDKATPAVAFGALVALVMAAFMVVSAQTGTREMFQNMFISDAFTGFGKLLALFGGAFALVLSDRWLAEEGNMRIEFPVLILFAVLGAMLMLSAHHLLALYLGLEMLSLSSYVLAAFRRDDARSSEAGIKYFVLGSLASGMLLFGMSLVYGFTGALGFEAVGQAVQAAVDASPAPGMVTSFGLVAGLMFVLAGFCFKVSAAPFHMWTPDVYEGAPTPVTAFFAMAPKAAAMLLLLRLLAEPFAPLVAYWQPMIAVIAALTMIAGALGALTQTNIKRLLAYSSIGHVGYALIGVAAGGGEGIQAVLVYMALYLFMTAGAFACVLLMRRNDAPRENISALAGMSVLHPRLALALAILMFSMAGIPPLAGFFGKMVVFLAAIERGMIALAIVGVLASVVACFYYLKIVKIMYFDAPGEAFDRPAPLGMRLALGLCLLVAVGFVFSPSPLTAYAAAAARALSM